MEAAPSAPSMRPETSDPEPARARLTLDVAVGGLLTVIAFLIGARPIGDNSFFTHLATGELILDTGSVPTADPYSITAAGDSWVVQSWLVSVAYGVLDTTLGVFGIRLFHGLLAAAVTAIVWTLCRSARSLVIRVACVCPMIIVGASAWSPRPLLVGLLGFVLVVAALERRIPLWTIVPVMWIWANSHGSFPLAGVLTGATMVGAFLDTRQWRSHETKAFAWVVAGTAIAVVNPVGVRLLTFPVHLLGRREALENVLEWQPLTFVTPWGAMMIPLLIGLAVAVARGARWRFILPASVFTLAAFLAVRNINVAAILLAVGMAPWLPGEFGSLTGREAGRIPRLVSTAVATLAVVAVGSLATTDGLDLSDYPIEDLRALAEEDRVANPDLPLISTESVGNYLTAAYGPEAAVFVDDRFDMYPIDVINDYETLLFGGDFRTILDRYDAQTVLWFPDGALEHWLRESPEWLVEDGAKPDETQRKQWIIARRITPSPAILAAAP